MADTNDDEREQQDEPVASAGIGGNVPASDDGAGGAAGGKQQRKRRNVPVRTTEPDEIIRHNISDEDLDMLRDSRVGRVEQFAWATAALATGGLPSTLRDLWFAFFATQRKEFGALELVQFALVIAGAVLAAAAFRFAKRQNKTGNDLAQKIRNRTAGRTT